MKRSFRFVPFVVLLAFCFINTGHLIGAWSIMPWLASILGAYFLIHRYTERHFRQSIIDSHQRQSRPAQLQKSAAEKLQREITQKNLMTAEQANLFARVAVEPSKIQKRIVEEYTTERRTLRREVTIDIELPESAEGSSFFFPVVIPPKGVLFDDLKVLAPGGEELPTLASWECVQVSTSVLHLLLAAACYKRPDSLPRGARDLELKAIRGILMRVDTRPPDRAKESTKPNDDKQPSYKKIAHSIGSVLRCTKKESPPDPVQEKEGSPAEVTTDTSLDASTGPPREVPNGDQLAKELLRLADVSSDLASKDAIDLAASLAKILTSHYVIAVSLPTDIGRRFILRYTCTLIPAMHQRAPRKDEPALRRAKWLDKMEHGTLVQLATLMGTHRWMNVRISLNHAWACQSYHVLVHCSENLYLSSQQLSLPTPNYLQDVAKDAPAPPHYRFRRRLGQSHAHFYGRYLPAPASWNEPDSGKEVKPKEETHQRRRARAPELILSFTEVPPGSLCRAALAAIASAALIWIIGYGKAHVTGGALSTDVPVLILAFPGVAASWLGYDSSPSELFAGTLTARLSLAATTVLSLLATLLYVVSSAPSGGAAGPHAAPAVGTGFSVLGISDWTWWTLVVAGSLNAAYLSYRWLLNVWRYRYLETRADPADLDI